MKNCLPLLLLLLVFGCKEKKIDLSGEVPLKIGDFISVFPKINPPFAVSDTNIAKVGDTTTIGYKAFIQFFPDSSVTPITGTNKKLVIRPIGLIEKENENYLLVKFITKNKTIHIAVFVTDKKNKYLASKELLNNSNKDEYLHAVSINREPTFLLGQEKQAKTIICYIQKQDGYTTAQAFL